MKVLVGRMNVKKGRERDGQIGKEVEEWRGEIMSGEMGGGVVMEW